MPAADGAQSFQRLTRAAMAMLDPLFDERPGRGPRELAADLAERIGECAQVAEAAGLRSLNYLATLLVPYAQRQAAGADWPSSRARIETWIADVVAFCAGHFDAIDAAQLVECLRDWPDFPPVPEQFVALISSRLGQDAARIDALARAAAKLDDDGPSAPEASGARASARGGPGAPDGRASAAGRETPVSALADGRADDPDAVATERDAVAPEASAPDRRGAGLVPERRPLAVGTKPCEVARDELDMLAEAVESLASETLPALAVPMQAYGDEGHASVVEAAELCAERFGHFVNAMSFVGFEPLAQLLELARDSLGRWRDDPSSLDDAGRSALMALPATLIGYLRDPTPAGGRALAEALAGDAWPVSLASPSIDAVADALARVGLVSSRQVARPETEFGEDDVSLDIATDADARVVDHLRRELPVLSARLSESIGRVLAGSLEDIASAQRTAHTLKGTANTVGIRGIATLTHLLEDLLQLLAKARRLPPAPLRDPIAQATDCVAEMAEAVAGIGPPPAGALAILRETARWIGRLLEDDVPEEDAPAAGDVDTAPADADADADATSTSISTSIGTATSIVTAASTGTTTAATTAGGTGAGRPSVAPPDSPAPSAPPAPLAPPGSDEEVLRVPAGVVDRMLDLAGEAAILLAQVQEQMSRLDETRDAFRAGTERLSQLSHELGRLVDTRGVSLSGRKHAGQFDALEFDEFNELHMVSRRIAESGADGKLLEQQLDQQAHVLADSVSRLERVQADLRETVMRSRMVTVATIVPRLQRAVRQAARMSGKPAQLVVRGEGAEVDAQLLQALVDPLTHLLRNAVDHGIEPAAQRARAGKPEEGRVELDVERQGHHLLIRCADDGGGLDDEAIRARAVELGMMDASARPDRAALARLVLQPGFSTRRSATQLSGRGIGLDVVARAVAQLRGTIEIASEPGRGTQILLSAPERVAAEPVTVARTSTHVLALSIRGVEQILAADGVADDENGVPRFVWQDGFVPVCRLDEAIGLPSGYFARQRAGGAGAAAGRDAPAPEVAMLVRMDAGHLVALIAPDLSQMRNAVLRPLPSWLARPVAVEGAAVLGDGTVAPVLDLPRLLAAQADAPAAAFAFDDAPLGRRAPVCLVVDDSVSVRRSMEAFLRDLGLEVECAGDGLEALAAIERRLPDVAILDLEMPNMDGLELASTLRHQERTCELPLIMITSRFSEKHRAMALDAGVDAFLTKPYGEDELASHVRRCLERHASLG